MPHRPSPPTPLPLLAALAFSACLLSTAQAHADPPSGALFDAFGTEVKSLMGEDIHFDAEFGLWFARLDGGLSALTNAFDDLDGGGTAVTKASRSIGTGEGLVRQVGLSVELKGNYAALNYLSDRLVEIGQTEADKRVDNPLARSLIEQFIGELRPDLSSLADLDAQVWLKGEFGRFRGEIDNPTSFIARNGKPYFPQASEPWKTNYFAFEIGLFPEEYEDEGFKAGYYARYRNFSRPLILGFGESAAELHLQDGEVTAVEFGIRAEIFSCETFCWTAEGTMVPFTGITVLDFGDVGWTTAPILAFGGNLEVSYPLSFWGYAYMSPYLGFRSEFLLPVAPSLGLQLLDEGAGAFQVALWNPDYFFWGPTAGVTMSF